jgi:hypothetical protein
MHVYMTNATKLRNEQQSGSVVRISRSHHDSKQQMTLKCIPDANRNRVSLEVISCANGAENVLALVGEA